jgi:hypothetical protein
VANLVGHDVDRGEAGGGVGLSFGTSHPKLANHTAVGVRADSWSNTFVRLEKVHLKGAHA